MSEKQLISTWGVALDDIPEEGLAISFDEFADFDGDVKVSQPFTGSLFLSKRGLEVKVKGQLEGVIVLTCDRCLTEYEYPIERSFEVLLRPRSSLNIEDTKELSSEELDVSFFDNNFIAFAEILREEVFLAIPYKSICSDSCKGICQICGKNLNEGQCECRVFKKSSPFAILKDLIPPQKDIQGG